MISMCSGSILSGGNAMRINNPTLKLIYFQSDKQNLLVRIMINAVNRGENRQQSNSSVL